LLIIFFGGGSVDHRKISWIDWQTICRSKEVGGLGVRRIKDFNIVLLGKWCWRLLVDRDRLWFRVLSSRYGVENGRIRRGGREASVWWKDVSALRSEEWFQGNVRKVVGDGKNTLFWSDVWVDAVPLRVRFNRLYELSLSKGESVFSMHLLGWGVDGSAWRWRRRLFAWEEELVGELGILLSTVILQEDRCDRWKWWLEPSSVYTVRSGYNFITDTVHVDSVVPASSLWHKDVPLKVILFAWRVFRARIPTKDNLFRRNVIGFDAQLCIGGCGEVETSPHLLFHCSVFGSVWNHILRWLRLSAVLPYDAASHYYQFSNIGGVAKARCSILQVIWFATVWEIWKERNNRIFNDKYCSMSQVVDKIKSLTYRWLKGKHVSLPLNYHGWWLSPFTILGIG
jgi:hypothetical protein